jgi:stage II sporulation protein AA (anti-sigma F factor antagonist)
LELKFTNKGSTLIMRISGELDHHFADYARNKMDNEILKSTTRNVIFDFSKLVFMDSSGVGVIAGRYKNIARLKGKAAIVCSNKHIKRILEMSGIFKLMPLYDSVDNAVQALNA